MASALSRTSRGISADSSRGAATPSSKWPYLEIELAHAVPCDSAILDGEKCVSMKMPCYLDRPERACNDAERRHSLCDQGKVT